MRPELNNIERIENYLLGKLDKTEEKAFMQEMEKDTHLKKEVEIQQNIMKGIERMGLKQTIVRAFKRYKLRRGFKTWGLGTFIAISLAAVIYLVADYQGIFDHREIWLNENGDTLQCDADKYLPAQLFNLDMKSDTVIETEGGIVMAIPADAFVNEKGKVVKGNIELEWKEALDVYAIITSGLATVSDGKMLETGGMFYINARKNGQQLKVNPGKEIYVEVPAQEIKSDMQLFDGKRTTDGSINWVNPKPLSNYLVPVDIHSLNFYPPGYEDSLAAWGYDVTDKAFKDSVFYSFSCDDVNLSPFIYFESNLSFPRKEEKYNIIRTQMVEQIDSTTAEEATEFTNICGVEPAHIKAIWNKKFNKTLLATKEFEARLPFIYKSCKSEVLAAYVHNLHLPMYKIDSVVSGYLDEPYKNKFLEFMKRKDGYVPIRKDLVKKLSAYYTLKSKLYGKAIAETNRKFREEQAGLDNIAAKKQTEHLGKDIKRRQNNYQKEFEINLNEAYRQLGYERVPTSTVPPERYQATVTSLGWKNIDRYVAQATITRKSLNYVSKDGKKMKLTYRNFTVQVSQIKSFDRIYAYLLSDSLYSFMKIPETKNGFKESVNNLLKYNIVCIAYKADTPFVYTMKDIRNTESLNISLSKISVKELKERINDLSVKKASKDIKDDLAYEKYMYNDRKRQLKNRKNREFRNKLVPVIFPCYVISDFYFDDEIPMTDTIVPFDNYYYLDISDN